MGTFAMSTFPRITPPASHEDLHSLNSMTFARRGKSSSPWIVQSSMVPKSASCLRNNAEKHQNKCVNKSKKVAVVEVVVGVAAAVAVLIAAVVRRLDVAHRPVVVHVRPPRLKNDDTDAAVAIVAVPDVAKAARSAEIGPLVCIWHLLMWNSDACLD
ncbi:hypothetical protein DYB36_011771 [Aphanomyces astaci]|uniref:Uncharacterized protein n=1 Tax=Aphanomyces astaci TaxID=112090 RepID=A0A397B614_APHAT|nr:hypothetical protein DYB36_011771 [Aphanomyces astaci]